MEEKWQRKEKEPVEIKERHWKRKRKENDGLSVEALLLYMRRRIFGKKGSWEEGKNLGKNIKKKRK